MTWGIGATAVDTPQDLGVIIVAILSSASSCATVRMFASTRLPQSFITLATVAVIVLRCSEL